MRAALRVLVVMLPLIATTHAYAECGAPPPQKSKVTNFVITYAPVKDGMGNTLPGCIAKTADQIYGYVADEAACKAAGSMPIEITPYLGCCDTGTENGATVCVARVNQGWFKKPIRAGGVGFTIGRKE